MAIVDFATLVGYYDRLEATSKRLEMTAILAELLRSADCGEVASIVYLTQGQVYPDFRPEKLGMADKLARKAISLAYGASEEELERWYKQLGDLGLAAEEAVRHRRQQAFFAGPLTLQGVYGSLERIASATGAGAQEAKQKAFAELLHAASPQEARYLARIVLGIMRLGASAMTIVDALSLAFATKEERDRVERAFNVCSDLGLVATLLCRKGIAGLEEIEVSVGRPMRPMLAERLPTAESILEKLGGVGAFDYKYDGLRIQAHVAGKQLQLFSRQLEDVTEQFPELHKPIREAVGDHQVIFEGECVPVDPNTGEFLPFQEVSRRRGRKYDLEQTIGEVPVQLIAFDLLHLDGADYTVKPYPERRAALEAHLHPNELVRLSTTQILTSAEEAERLFTEALQAGCEGLIAKSLDPVTSLYRAGAREWQWIKWKRDYRSEMSDTVDLVVVGAFAGRGKRAGGYGALLMAAYDPETEGFPTLCKLGSGFTDAMLAELPKRLDRWKRPKRDPRVESGLEADVWFAPAVVLEVLGAEITFSPIHRAGWGALRPDAGLAIRFPRFTGRYREDKRPEDATTTEELLTMYQSQLKTLPSGEGEKL